MRKFLAETHPVAIVLVMAEIAVGTHLLLNILSFAAHFFFVEPAFEIVNTGEELFVFTGIPYYDEIIGFVSFLIASVGGVLLAVIGFVLAGHALLYGIGAAFSFAHEEVFGVQN